MPAATPQTSKSKRKALLSAGYYVRVSGTVEGNANAQRPGIYVNLDMVELSAYGPEIVSGPDAGEAFGAAPTALPAGASPTPLTPPPTGAPGARRVRLCPRPRRRYRELRRPLCRSPARPRLLPPTRRRLRLRPLAPLRTWDTWRRPRRALRRGRLPLRQAPRRLHLRLSAPPIASPTRVMLPAANGHSYESLIAAGWTDETLRATG
jgi:hypothetical protein